MVKTLKTPNVSFDKVQNKDKYFEAQMKRVFAAFYQQPKTMLMVEVETGIMRPNICRYVAKWKKQNCIKIVSLSICPISRRAGVQRLTTNPEVFPKSNQIQMF
jgi:hypothetical protein